MVTSDPTGNFSIGGAWFNNAPSAKFDGQIDGLAIFNEALTGQEILDLYNAGTGV